ncbi:MAG: hypothetical protein ABSD92_13425 [Candidatus Bathyarchaeia archaeon]
MTKRQPSKKIFAKDELPLLSTIQFVVFLGGIFLYIDSLWLHTITETFNFTIPVVGSTVNVFLTWLVNNVHHSVVGVMLIWQYLAGIDVILSPLSLLFCLQSRFDYCSIMGSYIGHLCFQ